MRGWPGFDVRVTHKILNDAPDVNIKLVPASERQSYFLVRFLKLPELRFHFLALRCSVQCEMNPWLMRRRKARSVFCESDIAEDVP